MIRRTSIIPVLLFLLASCGDADDTRLVFTGTMEVNSVRVSAQTAGLLTRVRCDEGMTVTAGDTLATIDTEKLGYQLEQNSAVTEELTRQEQAAEAQLKGSTISRDNLRTKLRRMSALLASNAATQQSVDDLQAQLDAADEQLRAARISLSAIASRKMQIAAATNTVRRQVRDAMITAPVSGTVLVRYADAGELLGIGSPLCEIADLSELWTKIYIEEQQLPRVRLGQSVQIRLDGAGDRTLPGTISWIADRSEFTPKTILTEETRTTLVFAAKVTVQNRDGLLKIGMPVSVSIAQ